LCSNKPNLADAMAELATGDPRTEMTFIKYPGWLRLDAPLEEGSAAREFLREAVSREKSARRRAKKGADKKRSSAGGGEPGSSSKRAKTADDAQ
jgi:hypothetical protein